MVVVGRDCVVFDTTGKTCTVNAFAESAGKIDNVPIVDAVVAYDCPYRAKVYLLLMRNALLVSDIHVNLLPPFIVREAGLRINECPKSQSPDPTVDTHSLYSAEADLRIHFGLHNTFSYFETRKPTDDELATCDKIFITPDSPWWNPHSLHYTLNEDAMLDVDGDIVAPHNRKNHLVADEDLYLDLPTVDSVEAHMDLVVASALNADEVILGPELDAPVIPSDSSMAFHDMRSFSDELCMDAIHGKISAAIGSLLVDDIDDAKCLLFVTSLDELDHLFEAEVSALDGGTPAGVSPSFLKKIWSISEKEARDVITHNTQLNRHSADGSLLRQFSTNDRMLRYRRIQSYFFTDTMHVTKTAKSTRGNLYLQLFVSDKGYVAVYPMESKSDFKDALHCFCKDVGVPVSLVVDPSGEQTSKAVHRFCNQVGTTLRILEESTQWANRAELYIGLLKKAIRKDLSDSHCPMVLWDYCAQRRAAIHNLTPRDLFQNEKQSPHQITTGEQGDISNLCRFGWYEWCYYLEEAKANTGFPKQKRLLGRVLGPTKNEGNQMAQSVLTHKATVVPRRTCRPLTADELASDVEKQKRKIFDDVIRARLGDSMTLPPVPAKPDSGEVDEFTYDSRDSDEEEPQGWADEDPLDPNGVPIFENSFGDTLINAEVLLPQGEELQRARVRRRQTDGDNNEIGQYDSNPVLNTLIYEVEFPDGTTHDYAANVIAENMYSQVDADGRRSQVLDCILEHRRSEKAVDKADQYIVTKQGSRRLRKSTVGWKLLIRWKDDTEQWIPLKDMKENYPVQSAEYAVANRIDDEAAFCWWVPYTLCKRDRIISSVKARVKATTVKYGIKVPRSVAHAEQLDKENGNTLWRDAIDLEMSTILPAFDLHDDSRPPPEYSKSSGHLVFDVKMDFTRKARWVKDGHLTSDPDKSNYAGVVSRESVRIALTYAALNGLDVCAGDIKSAYLQAPSSEKHYIVCGAEFPIEWQGKIAIIRRALYGGKCAGSDYWKHMRTCMEHLGFESCKADPDVWMRKATHPSNGHQYWEYVLLYVDDCLCCSHRAQEVLDSEIGRFWTMKKGSVGPPTIYLGNKVSKVTLANDVQAWSFSSSQYVQGAVKNVETYLRTKNMSLPRKVSTPLAANYRPEIDVSSELNPVEAAYYMSLIGILRWIVELGRIDITCEVSMMASMMALPRKGHLEQLFHIFGYLKAKHNAEIVFDPTKPAIDESLFPLQDWRHTPYASAKETMPHDMKEARGLGFTISAYVDSDHAGDSVTRRSRTGYIVYLNKAPIFWFSKKQGGIETSSFGSEFIAMKQCCEYIRGLRYKLREMGIPVDGPAFIYGDNKSVLSNSSVPNSVLQKKSNSIAYHFVREGSCCDEWRCTYINTHDNIADLLTKPLGGEKRKGFIKRILYHIY